MTPFQSREPLDYEPVFAFSHRNYLLRLFICFHWHQNLTDGARQERKMLTRGQCGRRTRVYRSVPVLGHRAHSDMAVKTSIPSPLGIQTFPTFIANNFSDVLRYTYSHHPNDLIATLNEPSNAGVCNDSGPTICLPDFSIPL
jgi:hypothetical protein